MLDVDLCTEGLRLARVLHRLLPDEAMPAAVLALILLTEARRPARTDEHGDPVLLADQDRTALGPVDGRRGHALLEKACAEPTASPTPISYRPRSPYEHDRAPATPSTDWAEIVRLYDLLLSVAPSGPAALGRAVAAGRAGRTRGRAWRRWLTCPRTSGGRRCGASCSAGWAATPRRPRRSAPP